MEITHECQVLFVTMEDATNYVVNSELKPLGIQNAPYHDDHDHGSVSDYESVDSGPSAVESNTFGKALVGLNEGDRLYKIIKGQFVSGLGSMGMLTDIVSVRRNCFSSGMGQAKAQSFQIFAREMDKKRGGNGNLKYAWYGCSKDEIRNIITHGFSLCDGVSLSPVNSSIDSVKSTIADEDGIKHVLLCRVIMGKMEQVRLGCKQSHPSSKGYDSCVDNLDSPTKYIIWSGHMNTHILPVYLISFRTHQSSETVLRIQEPLRLPKSPWMRFGPLISALSKFMPHEDVVLISKFYDGYIKKKISRHELIRQVRKIAGDKLLASVIKSFGNKELIRR